VFWRRNAGADSAAEADGAGPGTLTGESRPPAAGHATTPGKGRPTPKRSEAERRRRQPTSAPGNRKAASQQARGRDRADRARRYEAMKRGEEWALAPRDKGPVKALTRDYVDSKRRFSEFYMYILLVMMVLLFARSTAIATFLYPLVLVLVAVILIEGFITTRAVRKLAAQRYPGESTRGVTMYAIMRSLQIRRFRMPAPRVKPGAKV
jgi:hypothetical protein